jgi:hypothetical protein
MRDLGTGDERSPPDHGRGDLVDRLAWGLPYDVDSFHLNPPERRDGDESARA